MYSVLVSEVSDLDNRALIVRLRDVEQRRCELEAEQSLVLAEADSRQVYSDDGHASMWGQLRASLGWSNGECRTRMRTARVVAEFADVCESLFDGRIPVASAAEIGRGYANPRSGDQIGDVMGLFVNTAAQVEYDELQQLVRRWETLADVNGAHKEFNGADEARTCNVGVFDGVGRLVAQFGSSVGAEAQEILEKFAEAEFAADWDAAKARHGDKVCKAHLDRSDAQRRADGLMKALRLAAAASVGTRLADPTLNVVIDEQWFEELLVKVGLLPESTVAETIEGFDAPTLMSKRRCETTSGVPIDPYLPIKIALEGHVRRVVCDSAGAVTDMGRKQRLFRGAAREALMIQSPRCVHPGCRIRVGNCEADRIQEYSKGGLTRPNNGAPTCRRHNQRKNLGYSVNRDAAGRWHCYRPDGTEIG
jgi:hypothetical protein